MVARSPAPPGAVAVVLAGGASSRMGQDKALLELDGEPLARRAARRLREVCPEVIAADRGRGLLPGLPSVPDGPGRGPAAGLLGAARLRPGRPLLVLAVDLPRVPAALLAELVGLARRSGSDLAVPRWRGGLEPLCALYAPAALAALEERVASGRFDLRGLPETPGLKVTYLEEEEIRCFGAPEEIFLNLNAPADLERLHGAGG